MPKMSYASIKRKIAQLEAQAKKIESDHNAKKNQAVAKVMTLMKKLGVEVADLNTVGAKGKRTTGARSGKRKTAGGKAQGSLPPKYRDPVTGSTWTGRGRPPVWLAEKIAAGQNREDFLIPAATQDASA